MSEKEYFEQLCSNSVDGTLTDAEREKLEDHLDECSSCAELKQDLEQMRALFQSEPDIPDTLHQSIMQRVEKEAKLKVVQPQKPVRRLPVLTMVSAAAVVVLVVLGGGLGQIFGRVTMSDGTPRSASVNYAGTSENNARREVDQAAKVASLQPTEETEEPTPPEKQQVRTAAPEPQPAQETPPVQEAPPVRATPPQEAPKKVRQSVAPEQEQIVDAAAVPQPEQVRMASLEPGSDAEKIPGMKIRSAEELSLPEALRGKTVAHCYRASGSGELPEVIGELLLTEGAFSYFLLENSMTSIQDTLKALEDAGYSVSAYDGVGLTIDSKAESWLLIVNKT